MPARIASALFAVMLLGSTAPVQGAPGSGTRPNTPSAGSGSRGPATAANPDLVWSYEGELKKGELDGRTEATIAGRFKLEGESVYALPDEEGSGVRAAGAPAAGLFRTVSTSGANPEPREIGKFRVAPRSGKLTLLLEDEQAGGLNGAMVLTRKKKSEDAWVGSYREKEGRKTVRTWKMTVTTSADE